MKRLHETGFSLTELMIVVTVAGILAAIAVPSFQSLNQSQQIKNASFELLSSLSLARSEAIKRNGNVTLTPTSTADWGLGWTITSAGGETIGSQAAMKGVSVSATGTPASVIFTRSGRATASSSFRMDVSPVNTGIRRCIVIGLNGMPYTKPIPVSSCP